MDLFGEIDDVSSESDEDQRAPAPRRPVSTAGTCGVPQNQQVERRISETRVRIAVPSIKSDLGNELYFVKLPRFLRIEPKPFDPQHYEDEFDDEKELYEEDKTRLKLKVENTIRWRMCRDQEGSKTKESNTRIVKWSDGSMSLHLGKEVFDIYKAPLQDNLNQLFIREDTGLRGQAIFKSKLTFRPHCTDGATYKKMTLSFGTRSSKTQIRILPMAGRDPEWPCPDLIKIQKKELRVSTPRKVRLQRKNQRQKNQQRTDPVSTIQKPKHDVEEEEVVVVGEGEDGRSQASSLVATKSRQQGAANEKQAPSSSDCNHEGLEEHEARGLLKAKRLGSDQGDKPFRREQGRKRKTEE
ncbi:RNA polymerase-associated protein LEO1-like [Rattus norvegicus]|nr:RNA polymerase-associated protein LEO1-like [Rattus norvegicus]XP_038938441.1 RNA polymerase-associated protein LEO1-like [Rattus norvegicus]|eukprot:XP_006243476.1 PREDICTED: RNA polymerase-associated protein LEO1-like [Rattus norvegicus]